MTTNTNGIYASAETLAAHQSDVPVQYDKADTWDNLPYRSRALCGDDLRKVMASKAGTPVLVIAKNGDELWTHAVLDSKEPVGDFGMYRFKVTIGNESHRVSEDRIRLA